MTHDFPLLLIGLTYSLYHCVGMCGGFVMAYSAASSVGDQQRSAIRQWPLHLLFNLGRVTSYTLMGAALGAAGSYPAFYAGPFGPRLQGVIAVAGGFLMILFAVSLLGFIRMPPGTLIGGKVVRRLFNQLIRSRSPYRTYPLGMLVGTVPCGLVYSMSSYALSSGSSLHGAMAMASFGFGTIPAMFCFGFVSTCLGVRVRKGLLWVAVVLTVVMGVEAIRRGLGAL